MVDGGGVDVTARQMRNGRGSMSVEKQSECKVNLGLTGISW